MSLQLEEFAAAIGVLLPQDEHLMSVVEQLFSSELPEGWTQHRSSKGTVYYYNESADSNQAEDPRVMEGRRRIMEMKRTAASAQSAGGSRALPLSQSYGVISPEEIKDLARHYGVNPRLEYHLLPLVRAAVLTPLPSGWQECFDSTGRPYFYNASMDQSTRRHPVDAHFIPLIHSMRGSGGSGGYPIMAFETRSLTEEESGSWVYFDFRSDALLGRRPADCPEGFEEEQAQADATASISDLSANSASDDYYANGADERGHRGGGRGNKSPRSVQIDKFLQQVRQDINAQVNEYKTQNLSSRIMDDGKIVKASKKTGKTAPQPRELVFYSWWFEEGVRRYLALHYDMKSKAFRIVLDKAVVLTDVKIAGRGGALLDCYDLFVGQRIDVLGKPTTLLQANFETLEWLEFHAGKLLQKARVLETELAKFKTTIASVTELAKKRSNGRGTHNLRWITNKVEELKKELQQHKPARNVAGLGWQPRQRGSEWPRPALPRGFAVMYK